MSRLVLIDLSSIWWQNWHANAENEVRAPRRATLDAIKRIVGDGGDLVAICCDSGTSFRKELDPSYKANRPEKDLAALGELDALKERLRADGYLLWECPGFEADDVIATAVAHAIDPRTPVAPGLDGLEVRIASADKDLLQLLREERVDCLRTHSWTVVGVPQFREKYGIEPAQFGDWLALVGDASDNIKGCPGVGPKTATELLKTYKNLWALLAGAENFQPSIGKAVTASLNANRAQIELARKLVALRTDAPIDFAQVFEKREPKSLTGEDDDPKGDESAGLVAGQVNVLSTSERTDSPMASDVTAERALVPVSVVEYEKQLEPTHIDGAFKLARYLYDSRLYSRFPTWQAIAAVVIRGRELGLGALTALDVFHVVEGRPVPHAHLITARAEAHPDCEYFMLVGSDETAAEYETKHRRHPKPTRLRYTIQQAVAAGLCSLQPQARQGGDKDRRSNWDKRRSEMLRKTCAVQLARVVYPSAALGLYAWEEMGGETD